MTTFAPMPPSICKVGSAARIRESSDIVPLRIGTLKSTLTRTVIPVTSVSLMDRFFKLMTCVIPRLAARSGRADYQPDCIGEGGPVLTREPSRFQG